MDESTDLSVVGMKLPKDPKLAATHLMNIKSRSDFPPFWVPNNGSLWLPEGVRKKREIAMAIITDEMFKMGFFELKYKDGTVVSLKTKDLSRGSTVDPRDITQKWVLCKKDEKNIRGIKHE